ncbi:MAG: spore photoproduct lyase family protein, partial [Chitinophagaceae bacterium]
MSEIKEPAVLERTEKLFTPWRPRQVLFTPDALEEPYGQEIHKRVQAQGIPIELLKNNQIRGLRGATERETYKLAKSTLAIVKAPLSAFNLQPIPPSADWQFHLAQGCPAHCHYCYLAGSLSGPPVIRVNANLPQILDNLKNYLQPNALTTFEASCYTDPLGIEHLTGGLEKTISFFGQLQNAQLRFVTKFTAVESLLTLAHNNNTRSRISINAPEVSKYLEGGVPQVPQRIAALKKLALPKIEGGGGFPVGVVLAPIMPIADWRVHYSALLDNLEAALSSAPDVT